jgi:serine/threonine-protein kinase PknG
MENCPRTGCGGTIEDGFCDTCGLEPPAASSTSTTPSGSTPSTRTSSRPTAVTAWTSPTSGTVATRSRRGSTRSTNRGLLGRGIVEIAPVPKRDPREAVLTNPEVPENKRFCSKCGTKVGRGREGRQGRVEGFCAKCGHHFDFTPKLQPGQKVGQYEVLGCIAHGGLGWIYLALDHAVADRWVVLKGLLDTGDADAMAAALAERRFLAQVEHPNIVKIFNFVEYDHDDRTTGYIVMEYVGGTSIKDMMKDIRQLSGDSKACLPISQAIAYTLEILPALGYLHGIGLVYCDFKPDNVIQVEEQLKLIDLGAVRHVSDEDSAIYGTIGYQAPEIGKELPNPVSDVYTVGRTLAVMSLPFDFQNTYKTSLPGPAEQPLLAEYESYYRLLLRATHNDPAQRFGSAEEMRDQLEGVFREVAAAEDGDPRPGLSVEFTPERRTFGVAGGAPALAEVALALPIPRVDGSDPGAAFLAGISATDTRELVAELTAAKIASAEVNLRLARAYIELGDVANAKKTLNQTKIEHGDWRVTWHRGLVALTENNAGQARMAFETVYDAVPGEAAPKLAMALCAEAAGDWADADKYYRMVWRTDRTYISAAFGLARALLGKGERIEAVDVLNSVPDTSSHHLAAQLAAVRARTGVVPAALTEEDLVLAGNQLARLELDDARRAHASRDLLESAYAWVRSGARGSSGTVLGHRLVEDELRRGLEGWYRTLARQAGTRRDRIALVDQANRVRPRTWI